ncbi:MAG: hypothetical protein CVU84_05300 [Firmicutes bacterium HGW-Firmicutes-1]|jgi:uncharacterized membrane protein|nr:MAG: hypothetical protein CVU84_05300 [Firmicutes bacterium HGW-Firmicutes-1]
MNRINVKTIAYTGIMMALVFLGTSFIKIPTPITGGYIHLGDGFVLLSGLILGPVFGAFAAGMGSALADIMGGYVPWALPTFLIKGCMAAIIGYTAIKKDNIKVILSLTTIFAFIWTGFNFLLRYFLSTQISVNSVELASQVNAANTSELIKMSASLQDKLLIAGLLIPLILVILLLALGKLSSIRFTPAYSLGFIISGSLMIVGYYFATNIMYGNYILPIFDIPLNILQFLGGIIIAHLLLPVSLIIQATMKKQVL